MEQVRINPAKKAEYISVKLSKERTPIAYQKKLDELIEQGAFETVDEAEAWLNGADFDLELYYQKECGLFAVDPEAVACSTCYSPYTGDEMVTAEDCSTVEILDRIYEAMQTIGSKYVCELSHKSYSDVGFFLSKIDRYERDNDCMYYQFWFHNDRGDFATIEINFNGEYAFGLSYVVKDNLRKVFGYGYTEELDVVKFVKDCLYDELTDRIMKLEKIHKAL